jgi:ribonucleoside-diphosphate reductase alpha chain
MPERRSKRSTHKGISEPVRPAATTAAEGRGGLVFEPFFSTPGVHPFDQIEWELRDAAIVGEDGKIVFEQKNVEVPKEWSQLATNVVASKYFYLDRKTGQRESSVKQLVDRVARTITNWGLRDGYFASKEDAETFYRELVSLLVHQQGSFNSPVWFNVGVEEKPQCSACFINSVQDTMESILDLAKIEGMLFKYGSGAGVNLSPLRSSKEPLSSGGKASGPVSFMRGFDAFAGVIKSGGKTRRAAKMVILNVDHPDILEFIWSKANEEKKAWALIDAGYDGSFDGEAYRSVFFQNANHSVRVTDEFMKAVEEDGIWQTRYVLTGEVADTYRARDIMRAIAEAAHICGDPGLQFDTTINAWHTCPNSGRINASNPCSEFMFLDDTACNLASLNLMRFRRPDGELDIEAFKRAVDVFITAQEIIVDNASYPTPKIQQNSHDFRPLGLGYTNLGALLMARGLPYDSEEGRAYAAAVTALMTGEAYRWSAVMASKIGPFPRFEVNREPMLAVIEKHRRALDGIPEHLVPADLLEAARNAWDQALVIGREYGFRNAQTTLLAPTGTISFMMDADTTGIEPDIALVKYKKLVGGGVLKMVNRTVPEALRKLGYSEKQIRAITNYIDRNDTIEGAPELKPEHLPVFDCAFKPPSGVRSIHYMGHIRMMAAVQPFLSGAISKTVNLPNEVTPEDIERVYMEAWRMGLKAIAIYRDGSKRTQPLVTKSAEKKAEPAEEKEQFRPVRKRLPPERKAITHKFSVAGHEGYITVGMYEDGSPGEIFIVMAKEGSTISGLMDCFATAISLALQYGVPLRVLVDKFAHTRFEPSGFTSNPQIPFAKSIMDYIFRWLALKFLTPEESPSETKDEESKLFGEERVLSAEESLGSSLRKGNAATANPMENHDQESIIFSTQADAPSCPECGAIMVRSGSCYKCINCGETSGCS